MENTVTVLYTSLQAALLAGARYWLYKDSLRVPAGLMYPILAAICLGTGSLWLLTGGVLGLSYNNYRIAVALLLFLLSCCVIREPLAKHALSYAFIMAYDSAFEMTGLFLQSCMIRGGVYVYVITSVTVMLLTFIPAVRALKRMIQSLSEVGNDSIWGYLCLICYTFLFMNLILTYPMPRQIGLLVLLSRYLMFLGMVGVYAAATSVMQTMRRAADAQASLELTERRTDIQQEHYERIISQMEDVRRMRHDYKHHRSAIAALIQNSDIAGLSAYLDSIPAVEDAPVITGNLAFDSVLYYYTDIAKSVGARVETDAVFAARPALSDPELCVVLGNLMENAVDAQRYVQAEQRFIRVSARSDDSGFTLAVDNRFDGVVLEESGGYATRKQGGGHGYGLGSVRAVCEKYGGVLQLETEGDVFMAGVAIGV